MTVEIVDESKDKQQHKQALNALRRERRARQELIERVSKEKPFREFIDPLGPETSKTYSKILFKFMDTRKFKSSSEMLPHPTGNLSVHEIEEMIKQHLLALREDGLSHSSRNNHFCTLKHFYSMNDVTINVKKLGRYVGEFELKNDLRSYTTPEIRAISAICDPRMKVVVLTLATTGMRIGALVKLKLKHLEKKIKDGIEVYQFTLYKNTREHSITFCHPECVIVIDSYLDIRKRAGEILAPDHPFIRENFDRNDLEQVRKHAREVSRSTISNILQRILVDAGIKEINHNFTKRERHSAPLNHGFRYWWMNQAKKARMDPEIRKRLFSHDTGDIERRYFKNLDAEPELLDEYIRCVKNGAFAISEEHALRQKVEMLEIEKSQYDRLQSDLTQFKESIGNKLEHVFNALAASTSVADSTKRS